MISIINRIEECDDGRHKKRKGDRIEGITLHMFAVPGIHDAAGIARFYRMRKEWTGGQMPYTYVVQPTGDIEQALSIFEVGPHALRWSSSTIGVVHIGDFNKHPPTPEQMHASLDLVAELCAAFELDPTGMDDDGVPIVAGHTERPRATRAEKKICPGALFCPGALHGLHAYRDLVRRVMREAAVQRLISS